MIKKIIIGIVILTITVGLVGLTSIWWLSLPDYNETVLAGDYSGIKNDIHIHRDQYGIPHINATTYTESMFGLGYVHAQDRLW